jgi:uncharacterized Fe-S cluster protein YjdI
MTSPSSIIFHRRDKNGGLAFNIEKRPWIEPANADQRHFPE